MANLETINANLIQLNEDIKGLDKLLDIAHLQPKQLARNCG